MKKNVGILDKVIRITFAVIVTVLYFMNIIPSTLGILLMIFAGVFLATSLISFCPLYSIFGINTCRIKNKA